MLPMPEGGYQWTAFAQPFGHVGGIIGDARGDAHQPQIAGKDQTEALQDHDIFTQCLQHDADFTKKGRSCDGDDGAGLRTGRVQQTVQVYNKITHMGIVHR